MGRWLSVVLIVSGLAGCSDDVTARKFRFETVKVAGDQGSARTPFVFYDGYYLQVVWSEDRGSGPDLYIQGFDGDGSPVGHPRRVTESHQARRPEVLQIGDAFMIAWTDRVDGMLEVMASGLNPRGGELLAAVDVSNTHVYASHSPCLVEFGGKPVLIYKERLMLASVHALKAVELDLQGRPEKEPLSFLEIVTVPYNPAVATNGRTIMIASNSFSSGKWSLAFTPMRSLKKQPDFVEPIETVANLWDPDIAPLGDDFLVAYRNNGFALPRIEVVRVDSEGGLVSDAAVIGGGRDFVYEPVLASDPGTDRAADGGDRAVVIWREELQGRVDLVGCRSESGDKQVLVEGVGPGDPASVLLADGNLCMAWETVLEGVGSVQVGCYAAPGGGW